MYLCSDHHEEIVHEGYNCPLCQIKYELEEAEEKIEELKKRIEELEHEKR